MMDDAKLSAAADALAQARISAKALDRLPIEPESVDLETAYRIQDLLHDRLTDRFGPLTGHKIGCTTKVMQEYLKIDHPCAGQVPATMVHEGTGRYTRADLVRPGIECEIAVVLGQDMPARPGGYDRAAAAQAVAGAMASIELVDERWTDFRERPTSSLVADDFFNAGCVLGAPVTIDPLTMDRFTGRLTINGKTIGEGIGRDILGHPMDALAWLANFRAGRGQPLKAGEFVTLGSIVKTEWIEAGDTVVTEIDGLGTATLTLA